MVRYLFYTIGDLTYQSPLVDDNDTYNLMLYQVLNERPLFGKLDNTVQQWIRWTDMSRNKILRIHYNAHQLHWIISSMEKGLDEKLIFP